LEKLTTPQRIQLGDKKIVMGTHSGTINCFIKRGNTVQPLTITNVIYAEHIKFSLLSVMELTNRGLSVLFASDGTCSVLTARRETVLTARKHNGLY
ncbi:hypothetical protein CAUPRSCDRAFT_3455, partial [Caulochytrium protostelioides]